MLQPMQPTAQAGPSPASSSFAGLLASLTSPGHGTNDHDETSWAGGDVSEDVATLSYEQALRAHARYRPQDRDERPVPQVASAAGTRDAMDESDLSPHEEPRIETSGAPAEPAEHELRSASVTIRLRQVECARLHRRAAEAGMTISAYLRSCALEADTLRAQVKQALAEIKAGNKGTSSETSKAAAEQGSKESNPRASQGVWLTRALAHIGKPWLGFSPGKRASRRSS